MFTRRPFFSISVFHVCTFTSSSSMDSALIIGSSAYSSSHKQPVQNSLDRASNTMMKSSGLRTAYTKSIVPIIFYNVCILGCGTSFPPLPNHGICIYCVEYTCTYPQTGKIFWLGKGGNVLKKNIFQFPICLVVKTNC